MNKVLKVFFLMFLIVQGSVTLPAMGDTIVYTGPAYTGIFPWGLDGGYDQWLASEFSLSKPTTISSIYGWMERLTFNDTDLNGNPISYPFTIAIYGNGGNVPGSQLFFQDFLISTPGADWYGLSGLNWSLGMGDYWVSFEVRTRPFSPLTYASMPGGFENPLINDAVYHDGAWSALEPSTLRLGINIEGTPVPLPPSGWLLASGLAGFWFWRKRRNL